MMTLAIALGVSVLLLCVSILYVVYKIHNRLHLFTQIDIASAVREEMRLGREESANSGKLLRDEIRQSQDNAQQILKQTLSYLVKVLKEQREEVTSSLLTISETNRKEGLSLRDEISKTQKENNESLAVNIGKMAESQRLALIDVVKSVNQIVETNKIEITTLKNDLAKNLKESIDVSQKNISMLGDSQKIRLDDVIKGMNQVIEKNRTEIALLKEDAKKTQKEVNESVIKLIGSLGSSQKERLDEVAKVMKELTSESKKESGILRDKIESQFKEIQKSNEQKLEEMRKTVDEKLHSTLEKRLGESFKIVSDRLEAVHRGLGEMQNLATGVGDLKRVLTNVKTRGTWGEIQLAAILEQILTPEQFSANVQIKENSRERVEYAVRLPGRNGDGSVWLPIDAKFPKDDYERLVDASIAGEPESTKMALDSLIRGIEKCAKDISDKYISPPSTTDFAIMFLPTEGLYAEVLRQPGLHDNLQQKYRVVITGPTTLAAVLNSLRMGFHTLAIEKRSSEVWRILGAVKTEFGKFGDIIDKVKGQLTMAANTLDATSVRTRAMERKLKPVTAIPQSEAEKLLQLGETLTESDA